MDKVNQRPGKSVHSDICLPGQLPVWPHLHLSSFTAQATKLIQMYEDLDRGKGTSAGKVLSLVKTSETENLLSPYVISVVSLLLLQTWILFLICIYYLLLQLFHLLIFVTVYFTRLNCFSSLNQLHCKHRSFPPLTVSTEESLAYLSGRELAGHNPPRVIAGREGVSPQERHCMQLFCPFSCCMEPTFLTAPTKPTRISGACKFYPLENRKNLFTEINWSF